MCNFLFKSRTSSLSMIFYGFDGSRTIRRRETLSPKEAKKAKALTEVSVWKICGAGQSSCHVRHCRDSIPCGTNKYIVEPSAIVVHKGTKREREVTRGLRSCG